MADPIFDDHPNLPNRRLRLRFGAAVERNIVGTGDVVSTGAQGQRGPPPRWHKILGVGASLVLLIFILVGVLPRFASYSGAWNHMSHLGA